MAKKEILKIKSEDAFFQKQEAAQIKALRESAAKECTVKYCDEHKNHCFRCGTQSLAEIQRGNVTIDICVNEGCGAVHLDPGEIDAILNEKNTVINIRQSILNVFK